MALSYARLAELRRRIALPVLKRVSGGIEGRHRSVFTGHGQDFDDMVPYHPGDDVSDIDWKASARAGEPVIRRFVKETNLSVVLAVDTSLAMTGSAPSGERKLDIAVDLADILAYLTRFRGDQLALVYSDAGGVRQLPPRSGSDHVELIRHRLRAGATNPAPDDVMAPILFRAESLLKRRSLVFIIGDDYSLQEESEAVLKRLRVRHDVVFFAIADLDLATLRRGALATDVRDGMLPDFLSEELRPNSRLAADIAAQMAHARERTDDIVTRLAIRATRLDSSADIEDALLHLFADRTGVRA
ncbi:hypothetical protein BSZ39_08160 [Bowdeniella nasicola]|uniref:DUF58 domain-containing protein n=1 Tax=Bowdeniella nasicola TaxID=208480 RepID=A0A1Q5Q1E9_9ACTO|nr:DUF58 domain-containing protein [Bowdeniella nasicola]OKL53693.1 hypothetical protein BSZ39_08160 [Bowdeniella nasicola]